MKFLHEYRDSALGWSVAESIANEADPSHQYRLMLFSGALSHAVVHHGLEELLPDNVRLLHGPGCTACAIPATRIEQALWLARQPGVTLCVFPEILPARGVGRRSLAQARADESANLLTIRSAQAALDHARLHPDRQVVLFATGFEAASVGTALALRRAAAEGTRNFFVLCCHQLTAPAMRHVINSEVAEPDGLPIDGLIAPGDVASVIGTAPFARLAQQHRRPIAVSGEEPLDLLQSIWLLIRRINQTSVTIDNQFARAADLVGNLRAQALLSEVFALREDFIWPALGEVPGGAVSLAIAYAGFDAEAVFDLPKPKTPIAAGCRGGDILRGISLPSECRLFGTACTPQQPLGPCMVSSDAPCGAFWQVTHRPSGKAPDTAEPHNAAPTIATGDVVIVSGTVGDEGVAALSRRAGIGFGTDVESNNTELHALLDTIQQNCPAATVLGGWMPGGIATPLNNAIANSGLGIILNDHAIVQDEQVEAACELLGVDVLHLASAGRLIAIVPADEAALVLDAMRSVPSGVRAAAIGRVVEDPYQRVLLQGGFGGARVVGRLPAGMDALAT